MRRVALIAAAAGLMPALAGEGGAPWDRTAWVRSDADSAVLEPPPHAGGGQSTAWRFFDDVPQPTLIFRKRLLHPGAAIGVHPLTHDEVYYVLEGNGELHVDGATRAVSAGTAVYLREGVRVGLRQTGSAGLLLIISYPPPAASP
jgi:mannose-6-phosphate isomerase-like protein (cupin superfamily)